MEKQHFDVVVIERNGETLKCYNVVVGWIDNEIGYANYSDILFTNKDDIPTPPPGKDLFMSLLKRRLA